MPPAIREDFAPGYRLVTAGNDNRVFALYGKNCAGADAVCGSFGTIPSPKSYPQHAAEFADVLASDQGRYSLGLASRGRVRELPLLDLPVATRMFCARVRNLPVPEFAQMGEFVER
jgi:hypothetical protein